jgi:hypothetical protein
MEFAWLLAVGCVAAGIALLSVLVGKLWFDRRRAREVQRAMQAFKLQRELLEAKFFDLASTLGKPRGLRWLDCEWLENVTFARDLNDGLLTAFVAVNIRFEAIAGGDMEDVAAVGNIREAAAVFHYRKGRWGTGGRALFNMNPEDAVSRLQGQYEAIVLEAG